jgi:hypothetical protein
MLPPNFSRSILNPRRFREADEDEIAAGLALAVKRLEALLGRSPPAEIVKRDEEPMAARV